MPERRFRAVLLDLFDTLVRWEPSRLPEMEIGGTTVRSTIPYLIAPLERSLGDDFHLAPFVDAYRDVMSAIEEERLRTGLEVTCAERFRRTLARLEIREGRAAALADELTRVHMTAVRAVTSAPPENVAVVRRVVGSYRLGLLSNFDDARTGREILADTGVADRFEVVVISGEVGVRKPHPAIFRLALGGLALAPADVLFVGDNPRDDIGGARAAGVPVVWLNPGATALPDGVGAPDYTIRRLTELPALLGL